MRQQKSSEVKTLSIKKLDRYLQNQGRSQFTYEVFKSVYDSDPRIQNIVADFDQQSITLKTSEMDDVDVEPKTDGGGDTVSTMAKRAVDLKDL